MDRTRKLAIKLNNRNRYYRNIEYPEIPLSPSDTYVTTSYGDS